MAKKKKNNKVHMEMTGQVRDQSILETLETNYMPYAISVILSRALPEIDGFKPSHRKLLYTMYKMGLLTGSRTKSANVVGETMKLNPHGDSAIYETMVRLARGNETLLHPYVDSKGNFGKAYSRDMDYAASRYTEVKLDAICNELFRDIDKDTIDFVGNYDNTTTEPLLLPASFPSILVNMNLGIAVGMASNICSFNLNEICDTTIAFLRNPEHDISSTLPAPDFSGGGILIYNRHHMDTIYKTGRGNFKVRSKYQIDPDSGCIEIIQIPPTTTAEAIIDKVVDLVKNGTLREITGIRDETDLSGLKIAIDLKRGTDPHKLMKKLYRITTLEDTFSCNFNVLIAGVPRVLGIADLLQEWIAFRKECVRRRIYFDLRKAKDKLHLLQGLSKILLDIDKAIRLIRETGEETEVVPNLMIGFGIDQTQAEYVAEIKLRHLNREYILKRTQEIEQLLKEIDHMEAILSSDVKIRNLMIKELEEVSKKYGKARRTEILYTADEEDEEEAEELPDYPVSIFITDQGYLKKITPQSLRMSGEQKLKDGDHIARVVEGSNRMELLAFTNKQQCYKMKLAEFEDSKASLLGDYLPARLELEPGESLLFVALTRDFNGYVFFLFENGKGAKIPLASYRTKQNRRKLVGAFSDKSPLADAVQLEQDAEFIAVSSSGRMLLFHTAAVAPKSTKNTIGVSILTLKKNQKAVQLRIYEEGVLAKPYRYRVKNLPGTGAMPAAEDIGEQLELK